jgi:cytochrome b561
MAPATRYHPLLVILHWLVAGLILAALLLGYFVLAAMPNADPAKIKLLLLHMSGGMAILALMVVRFLVRVCTRHPPSATSGHPLFDRLVPVVHYGFYALVLAMVATGYATGILAGLNRSVFQGTGEPLPPNFAAYPTFTAHGYLAFLLAGAIALHVAAALYHALIREDGLLWRMSFRRAM